MGFFKSLWNGENKKEDEKDVQSEVAKTPIIKTVEPNASAKNGIVEKVGTAAKSSTVVKPGTIVTTNTTVKSNTTVESISGTHPNEQKNPSVQPITPSPYLPPSGSYSAFEPLNGAKEAPNNFWKSYGNNSYVRPAFEKVNLTVVLVENTKTVANHKDKVERIVKSLASNGFVVVINYGSVVREGDKFEAETFDVNELFCKEDIGEKACFFDALLVLDVAIAKYYQKFERIKFKRVKIDKVDVIGIGTGIDNESVVNMEKGIESFERVLGLENVTTKYFCINEENFISVAAIGFRSIGAIVRT